MKVNNINRCTRCMNELEAEGVFCPHCGYKQDQSNPERALPAGTVLNGKYMIGAVLGEGGFGITYAAWDMLIGTRIAVKEYFPSELVTRNTTLQEENAAKNLTLIQERTGESRYREGLARFVKEAENLAKFQKELGIASVKDFFYENNTAYMVMEYIDGVTLNSYLEKHNGKLEKDEVFRMMEPVMKTLEAVHKEGVIHRDISPDNIMVTTDGRMKLIDFGAARFVGADDEKSLTVILKHGYAPEEQYRSNGEQGAWTDVYALSAVIYRMLTGKVPEETLKRMTEKQESVHAELVKVPSLTVAERKSLEKGLAVKAEKRYRTIEGLYEGIYGNGEQRRNVWKLAAGAGVAAALVLAVVSGIFPAGMQDKEEEDLSVEADVQEPDDVEIEALALGEGEEMENTEMETETEGKETADEDESVVEEGVKFFSEEELEALIEEQSGKYIGNIDVYENGKIFSQYYKDEKKVSKKTACYDDYDGDGRYELFAFVADEWGTDFTDFGLSGDGCSIWFSDGEQTVWVTDIEDPLSLYGIGILQFGKMKHFNLWRHDLGAFAGGNRTTTCALEGGIPQAVFIDEYVILNSEEGNTYCLKMQHNLYDTLPSERYYEEYPIFYRDGEYWEYASKIISETELQQYGNSSDILNQIMERGKSLYDVGDIFSDNGWEYDFSGYPYMEVESILLNSKNEIIVNMRHWKSEEEAEYYKSLTDDDLRRAMSDIIGAASFLSETRLAIKDNMLQIEEMKMGHREVSGTEFTPLYPN